MGITIRVLLMQYLLQTIHVVVNQEVSSTFFKKKRNFTKTIFQILLWKIFSYVPKNADPHIFLLAGTKLIWLNRW